MQKMKDVAKNVAFDPNPRETSHGRFLNWSVNHGQDLISYDCQKLACPADRH